jgi:hypothetical protein
MPASEVDAEEFCRRLSPEQVGDVRQHLASGRGLALYSDERSRPALIVTFGTRDSDVAGLPPAMYGGHSLSSYVPARPQARAMRSPLMDVVIGPPQIHRPRVAPGHTEYPSVELSMRTSGRPRGDYITPLVPSRQPEPVPVPPAEPALTEDQRWWQDRLR